MTIQATENLIFNGKKIAMQVSSSPELPLPDPRIVETGDDDKHSGCWRGFVGTWEVKEEKLFLVNLCGKYAMIDDTAIFADWFTGTIVAPQGEIIHHPGNVGEYLHEADLRIEIENGIVLRTEMVNNQDKLKEMLENQQNTIELDIPPFLRRQAD